MDGSTTYYKNTEKFCQYQRRIDVYLSTNNLLSNQHIMFKYNIILKKKYNAYYKNIII